MNDVLQKSAEDYEPRGRLDPAGFESHVSFQVYPPPADLAPFLEHGWAVRWEGMDETYHSEEVMHRPYVDLFLSSEQSGIQATFRGKRTYVAAGSGRILGVRFRPGAFHAIWDGTMADIQDQNLDVEQVFPQWDRGPIERLLALQDAEIVAHLFDLVREKQPQPDPNIELINEIITAIESDGTLQTVSAVGNAFARSERGLQQLFQDYLGVGLKWLLQRRRLLAAAGQIRATEKPDWAAIAYNLGYSSQQHFITDFKQVLGKTPKQYKKGLTA
jgi:AraC-like DNA-binding protein